jgi:hypothetical protein
MAKDGKHFFMWFLAIWISSFEKVLFSSVVHFFIVSLVWGELFFELPAYSGYQSLVGCIPSKDFLQFCGWPLQFRDHLFCYMEAFQFHVIPFVHPFS